MIELTTHIYSTFHISYKSLNNIFLSILHQFDINLILITFYSI